MSYLRGLVHKTRAARPQIAPRAAPVAAPTGLDIAEAVEEVVVASRRPAAAIAPAASAARPMPHAPRSVLAPPFAIVCPPPTDVPHDDLSAGEPQRGPLDRAVPAAAPAGAAPRPPQEIAPPSQTTVSRRSRTIRRRVAEPRRRDTSGEVADDARLAADRDDDAIVPVRAPRPAAREPSPWRSPRPAPAVAAAPPQDREPSRPDVHISIGRLEVRANVAAPAKAERPAAFRPALTLQDYLAGRSRGR
jgi:hypothetical protein